MPNGNQQGDYQAPLGSLYGGQWSSGDPGTTQNPWDVSGNLYAGTGARGLPKTFRDWNAPARAAFPVAGQYAIAMEPALAQARESMNTDWYNRLYGVQKDATEAQFGQMQQQRQQGMQRAGTTGGATTSPMFNHYLQTESAARSGALGQAARLAMIQADQMRSSAQQNYMNLLAQRFQAQLAPMMIQAARNSTANIGAVGPGVVPAATAGAGGFINAAM